MVDPTPTNVNTAAGPQSLMQIVSQTRSELSKLTDFQMERASRIRQGYDPYIASVTIPPPNNVPVSPENLPKDTTKIKKDIAAKYNITVEELDAEIQKGKDAHEAYQNKPYDERFSGKTIEGERTISRDRYRWYAQMHKQGLLSGKQQVWLSGLIDRNLVPAPDRKDAARSIIELGDIDKASEDEVERLTELWASFDNLSWDRFSNDMDRKTGLKKIQNMSDETQYKKSASKYMKLHRLSKEEQQKFVYNEMYNGKPEEAAFESEEPITFYTGGGVVDIPRSQVHYSSLENMTPESKQKMVNRAKSELLPKDFLLFRGAVEGKLSSEAKAWAVEAAHTGVISDAAWDSLSVEDKPYFSQYVNMLRPREGVKGVVGGGLEFGERVGGALVDIVKGGFVYGRDLLGGAWLAYDYLAYDNIQVGQTLLAMDELQKDDLLKKSALSTKWIKRNMAGEASMIFAESLPYMYLVGLGGPVGMLMAGTSMARDFRDKMVLQGVEPQKAMAWAPVIAAGNVAIEAMSNLIPGGKGAKGAVAKILARSTALRWSTKAISFGAVETFEEVLQAGWEDGIGTQFVKHGEIKDLDEIYSIMVTTAKQTAKAMPLFGAAALLGGSGRAYRQRQASKFAMQLEARELEILDEHIREIDDTINTPANQRTFYQIISKPWKAAKTDAERRQVLVEYSFINPAKTMGKLKTVLEISEKLRSKQRPRLDNNKVAEMKNAGTILGFQLEAKSGIGSDDEIITDMFYNKTTGKIEYNPDALTNDQAMLRLREEAIHGISVQEGITTQERALFAENLEKWDKEYKLTERLYSEKGHVLIEEAMAQKGAALTTESRTFLQKLMAFFKRIFGNKDENIRATFDRIISRREQAVSEGRVPSIEAKAEEEAAVGVDEDVDAELEVEAKAEAEAKIKADAEEGTGVKFETLDDVAADIAAKETGIPGEAEAKTPSEVKVFAEAKLKALRELEAKVNAVVDKIMGPSATERIAKAEAEAEAEVEVDAKSTAKKPSPRKRKGRLAKKLKQKYEGFESRRIADNRVDALTLLTHRIVEGGKTTQKTVDVLTAGTDFDTEGLLEEANIIAAKLMNEPDSPKGMDAVQDIVIDTVMKEEVGTQERAQEAREQVAAQMTDELGSKKLTKIEREVSKLGIHIGGINLAELKAAGINPVGEIGDGEKLAKSVLELIQSKVEGIEGAVDSDLVVRSYRSTLGRILRHVTYRVVPDHLKEVSPKTGKVTKSSKKIALLLRAQNFNSIQKTDGIPNVTRRFKDIAKAIDAASAMAKVEENIKSIEGKLEKITEASTKDDAKLVFDRTAGRAETVTDMELATLKAYKRAISLDEDAVMDVENAIFTLQDDSAKPEDKVKALDKIQRKFPSLDSSNVTESGTVDAAGTAIEYFSRLDAKTPAEASDAENYLDNYVKRSKEGFMKRKEKYEEEVAEITEGISTSLAILKSKWRSVVLEYISALFNGPLAFLERVFSPLAETSKLRHQMQQAIFHPIEKARTGVAGAQLKLHSDMQAQLAKIFTQDEIDRNSLFNEDLAQFDELGAPITKWQLMNTYLQLQNASMELNQRRGGALQNRYRQMPDMRAHFTKADLKYMEWLREELEKRFPEVAANWKRLTGRVLKKEEMYWPINIYKNDTATSDFMSSGFNIRKSFTHARIPHKSTVSTNLDVNQVFMHSMESMDRFINYSDVQIMLKSTFFKTDIMNQLNRTFGTVWTKLFKGSLQDEMLGYAANSDPLSQTAEMDFTRNLIYRLAIPHNWFSGIKQLADVTSVGSDFGVKWHYYFAQTLFTKAGIESLNKMKAHPGLMADTILGGHPDILVELDMYLSSNVAKSIWDLSSNIVANMDAVSRLAAASATYRTIAATPEMLAISDLEAREEAILNKTNETLRRQLQSPVFADRPVMFRRGGSMGKYATMFTSALTPKVADELNAINTAITRKDWVSVRQAARKIAHYHFIAGTLQWVIAQGVLWGVKEEDEDKFMHLMFSIILGPFSGLPVVGTVLDVLSEKALGEHRQLRQPLSLVTNIMMDTIQVLRYLSDKDIEEAGIKTLKTFIQALPIGRVSNNIIRKALDIPEARTKSEGKDKWGRDLGSRTRTRTRRKTSVRSQERRERR